MSQPDRTAPAAREREYQAVTHHPKVAVVEVLDLSPLTEHWHSRVVLVMPDGEEYEMTSVDAQKLGHALNNAGGGTLDAKP